MMPPQQLVQRTQPLKRHLFVNQHGYPKTTEADSARYDGPYGRYANPQRTLCFAIIHHADFKRLLQLRAHLLASSKIWRC